LVTWLMDLTTTRVIEGDGRMYPAKKLEFQEHNCENIFCSCFFSTAFW
jgi:hypothetical protein